MTTKDADGPKSRKVAAREARLAAALRANLRRRKAQVRGRDTGPGDGTATRPEPVAEKEP
ncbi:MAG: hypothetical protein Q8M26_03670 [Pseudolabrys sp.]|nr:hypothetical protein [Pseudolabrys sp.]